jgi:hypothetical protein
MKPVLCSTEVDATLLREMRSGRHQQQQQLQQQQQKQQQRLFGM